MQILYYYSGLKSYIPYGAKHMRAEKDKDMRIVQRYLIPMGWVTGQINRVQETFRTVKILE